MVFSKKVNTEYLLVFIFIFSFAFDFKGDIGGSAIQYLMATANMGAFLLLGMRYRFSIHKRFLFILSAWIFFLVIGSLGAVNSGMSFNQYIRTIYPFILFFEGLIVVQWFSEKPLAIFKLIDAMIFSSVVSFVFIFMYGVYFTGLSLEKIRYQILSPLTPFLIIILGVDFFITGKKTFKLFFLTLLVMGAVTISATRGILLSACLVGILVLLAWVIKSIKTIKMTIPRHWLLGSLLVVFFATVGIFLVWSFFPSLIDKFINRLFGPANMVTVWYRLAAVVGQWEQLLEQPITWFIGSGFGQSYYWSKIYIPHVLPYTSPVGLEIGFYTAKSFPGEFMWMPFLYYGGFLGGGLVIIILLWGAMRSFRTLINLMQRKTQFLSTLRYRWISILGFFIFLAQGITANPFIIRQASLWFGILFGLAFVDWHHIFLRIRSGLSNTKVEVEP